MLEKKDLIVNFIAFFFIVAIIALVGFIYKYPNYSLPISNSEQLNEMSIDFVDKIV